MSMVEFMANVLPIIEITLTCVLSFAGFALIVIAFVQFFQSRWNYVAKVKCQMNFKIVDRSIL